MELLLLPILVLMVIAIGLAGTILWVWMLVDCATKEPSEGNDKLVWIVVIVALQLLGAILYLLIRRPERIRKYGA